MSRYRAEFLFNSIKSSAKITNKHWKASHKLCVKRFDYRGQPWFLLKLLNLNSPTFKEVSIPWCLILKMTSFAKWRKYDVEEWINEQKSFSSLLFKCSAAATGLARLLHGSIAKMKKKICLPCPAWISSWKRTIQSDSIDGK